MCEIVASCTVTVLSNITLLVNQNHLCVLNIYVIILTYVCMHIAMYLYYFYVAKSQITRPFTECFEKGTPNFLSVPPCT